MSTTQWVERVVAYWMILMGPVALFASVPSSISSAQEHTPYMQLARAIETDDLGIPKPVGLAFSPKANGFLVVQARAAAPAAGDTAHIFMIAHVEDFAGPVSVASRIAEPLNLAFDGNANRLLILDIAREQLIVIQATSIGRLAPRSITRFDAEPFDVQNPRGMTVDPASGRLFILDSAGPRIVRIDPGSDHSLDGPAALRDGRISEVDLKQTGLVDLRGIAFNPADGHLYLLSPAKQALYELTETGQVVATRDLSKSDDFKLVDSQSMVFAPSGDQTDDPASVSLYIADSGPSNGGPNRGRIFELSLTPPVLADLSAAAAIQATLVRMTDLSQWSPPSPDPMGVAYLPTSNRLMISDSEVLESPAIYSQGVNVFESTLPGSLVATYSTVDFSNEPTGVAFHPTNGHLFFCDDDADKVFEINPGADGLLFTADDTRTFFSMRRLMSNLDAEGLAFDTVQGYLYLADGVNSEIWEIRPGANGLFDGVPPEGDDQASHFDTSSLGITDPEAVEFNPDTGTLYISGRGAQQVIETTRMGTLLSVIDITFLNAKNPSGLAYAPSSVNASEKNLYIVARGVDNDADPNENDGRMYEITLRQPAATPTASFTPTPANTPSPTATETLTPKPTETPRALPDPVPLDHFVYLPAVMLQTDATLQTSSFQQLLARLADYLPDGEGLRAHTLHIYLAQS